MLLSYYGVLILIKFSGDLRYIDVFLKPLDWNFFCALDHNNDDTSVIHHFHSHYGEKWMEGDEWMGRRREVGSREIYKTLSSTFGYILPRFETNT